MNKNLSFSKTIKIAASKSKVWDALVNPAKIKIYLFGTEAISDWKAGSEIIFQGEYNGQHYKDKGKIVQIKKEEILSYKYWSAFTGLEDKPENYSLVTCKLSYQNNETSLTISQDGFVNEEGLEHSEIGWTQVSEKIKEIAESEKH